jgi:tellurite resistance protein
MAGKDAFTEDEWKTLQQGLAGAGMLVSTADRDFTDSFGEASALAKELHAHAESESELVRALSGVKTSGFGVVATPSEVEGGTLAALQASVQLLVEKAPDELEAYRAFVLDVANRVAAAKGGVKETETAAIEKITAALAG